MRIGQGEEGAEAEEGSIIITITNQKIKIILNYSKKARRVKICPLNLKKNKIQFNNKRIFEEGIEEVVEVDTVIMEEEKIVINKKGTVGVGIEEDSKEVIEKVFFKKKKKK